MLPLSPALLIAAANAFVGLDDSTPEAPGARPLRAQFLREVKAPAENVAEPNVAAGDAPTADAPTTAVRTVAWHTAFVHHVGYWSHYDVDGRHSSWPLPPTNDPSLLAHFARKRGVLVTLPGPGDIFLLWSPRSQRFVRSGIVVSIEDTGFLRNLNLYYDCVTIEGDTDESMAASGGRTLRHLRTLSSQSGDRFIRWRDIPLVRETGGEQILADGSFIARRAA